MCDQIQQHEKTSKESSSELYKLFLLYSSCQNTFCDARRLFLLHLETSWKSAPCWDATPAPRLFVCFHLFWPAGSRNRTFVWTYTDTSEASQKVLRRYCVTELQINSLEQLCTKVTPSIFTVELEAAFMTRHLLCVVTRLHSTIWCIQDLFCRTVKHKWTYFPWVWLGFLGNPRHLKAHSSRAGRAVFWNHGASDIAGKKRHSGIKNIVIYSGFLPVSPPYMRNIWQHNNLG